MTSRSIPGDWHCGAIPENVDIMPGAHVETSYSFLLFRSRRANGLRLGTNASAYGRCMFDMGPEACFSAGDYTLLNGIWLICDNRVSIGDYCLLSWNVVIMDSYRASEDCRNRRAMLRRFADTRNPDAFSGHAASPVTIGNNVWIGFDCCVLPGTTIGDGAIIGARSVVSGQVPANSLFAGNPARFIRWIIPNEIKQENSCGE